jgi:hypothetical protein
MQALIGYCIDTLLFGRTMGEARLPAVDERIFKEVLGTGLPGAHAPAGCHGRSNWASC